VVSAVLHAGDHEKKIFQVYNVATGDYITVNEIADLAVEIVDPPEKPIYEHTGGDRGWKGDVPVVRLNTDRIQSLGWKCSKTTREALKASILSLHEDERTSKL
jgi:UDP-glucose 4-epimerase